MTKGQSALLGGVLGAGAVMAIYLAGLQKRVEAQAEQIGAEAGQTFLAENYGLTPLRIQRISAYGTATSSLVDALKELV